MSQSMENPPVLTILHLPYDNVMGVRIDGKLDADDIEVMLKEMNEKLDGLEAAEKPRTAGAANPSGGGPR